VLYRFEGGNNGSDPFAGLVRDAKGNLYGTTQGNGYIGASVMFKVNPQGQQTVLFVAGEIAQGCCLDSPVAVDAEGNLYGMSPYGGKPNCGLAYNGLGCGTSFKVTPSGKFKLLHVFKGKDGIQPEGSVVLDAHGNIYGTAVSGGNRIFGIGTVNQPRLRSAGWVDNAVDNATTQRDLLRRYLLWWHGGRRALCGSRAHKKQEEYYSRCHLIDAGNGLRRHCHGSPAES
jgi:hypothetical protein